MICSELLKSGIYRTKLVEFKRSLLSTMKSNCHADGWSQIRLVEEFFFIVSLVLHWLQFSNAVGPMRPL